MTNYEIADCDLKVAQRNIFKMAKDSIGHCLLEEIKGKSRKYFNTEICFINQLYARGYLSYDEQKELDDKFSTWFSAFLNWLDKANIIDSISADNLLSNISRF